MIVPCKNCTDRTVGCHSKCDKYKQWKEEHDAKREERYKRRLEENIKREDIKARRKCMKTRQASNRFK